MVKSNARVTPITREGVGCAAQLSAKGQIEHYTNFNHPRVLQRINRERRARGEGNLPRGERY